MKKKGISITGAGPAGLSAAINLADQFEVEVFEKEKDVGMKWEGSLQFLENYTSQRDVFDWLEDVGIEPNFYSKPFFDIEVIAGRDKDAVLSSKKPLWYVVRRGNQKGMLDYALKKQAERKGVKINFMSRCKEPQIIATGPSSVEGLAREAIFETRLEDTFLVFLDNEIAPGGYAYLVVADRVGTVCTAITKNFENIDAYFKKTIERAREKKDLDMRNARIKTNFVSFYLTKSAKVGSRIYVGEAAGFQDFVFGFGLRYAICSGYLAARSITEKMDYDLLWKREFGEMLELGILNRWIYEWGGNPYLKFLLEEAKRRGDFRKFLKDLNTASFSKKLLIPLAKIGLGKAERCNHIENCVWCPRKKRWVA
ncbi:MAG: NAD(P)/FAD-dependent oxidoreductase [Candidatus Anstonellales archaeon]